MHKTSELKFKDGTTFELSFQTGETVEYDISVLFDKYPQLTALQNRDLFLSGKLNTYGIVWNEDLDIDAETIFEDGVLICRKPVSACVAAGNALSKARADAGLSQSELSRRSGIDQSDISKIERGIANPSINTLARLAKALEMDLNIEIK